MEDLRIKYEKLIKDLMEKSGDRCSIFWHLPPVTLTAPAITMETTVLLNTVVFMFLLLESKSDFLSADVKAVKCVSYNVLKVNYSISDLLLQ